MHDEANSEVQSTLLLAGGIALMAMGAGMLMTHPALRGAVLAGLTPLLPELKGPVNTGLAGLLPDVERYMRIKSM